MQFRKIKLLYKKELMDVLRDKKTIFTMVVLPVILYPLIFLIGMQIMTMIASSQQEHTYQIAYTQVESQYQDTLNQWFQSKENKLDYHFKEKKTDDPAQALKDEKIDAYITTQITKSQVTYQIHYLSAVDNSSEAADMLKELAEHKEALAVGPGLGREEGAWLAIEALVKSDIPKVIDADALFLLAKHGGSVGANTVLTPHPGEMARLCGMTTQAVLAAPVETAQQLAADLGACVLLKGATTVIAQGEDVAMNVTGCDGMGTGGCGDVLTGVIAALLAQGMSAWDAARVGAFYHGRAGEAAQKKLGARGVTAWDVCEALRIE